MKKNFYTLILLLIILPITVFAHPGRTDSNGCHTCRKNCASWGLSSGEYHCHNGSYSSNNKIETTRNTTTRNTTTTTIKITTTTQKPKSNDNTLKAIIIDGESLDIENELEYITKNESVDIEVVPNDEKATYEIIGDTDLSIGENQLIIVVEAEDGAIRKYVIDITREVILSSNTDINIFINGEEVIFDNFKANINVNNSITKIDFDYELDDEKSRIEYDKINDLKVGNNYLKIKVIAEDGSNQIYNIVINRATKSEKSISTIVGLGVIISLGCGVYLLVKKRKIIN